MTNEEKQVADWMVAFGQEVPDKPTIPSLEVRKLRARLILEEALETIIHGLGLGVKLTHPSYQYGWIVSMADTINFAEIGNPLLTEISDGCADLMVVTLGTKAACGLLREYHKNDTAYGTDPIFSEVMRSNWTKLWTHKEVVSGPVGLTYVATKPEYEADERAWLVMDAYGKVIKSPSTEQPNLEQFIK